MNSKLQIISGRFHGRKLYLPRNARPTQNRAREALFNIISSLDLNIPDVFTVWDAFAGSGAFGIEFLSRYPSAKVIFTDVDPESMNTVRKNLALLDVGTHAITEQTDALQVIKKYGTIADITFVDSPYDMADTGVAFIRALTRRAKMGAFLIWEQEAEKSQEAPRGWLILKDRTYGRARFFILKRIDE